MIYLDNAATTQFKPPSVLKAVMRELTHSANPGRGGHRDAIKSLERVYETREAVANFVGLKEGNIIFTSSCTEALNLAIFGTARHGHIITTSLEHNSVLRPLYKLKMEKMIELTIIQPDEKGLISPKKIERAMSLDTYLVCVNAMSNLTGAYQNLAAIGEITTRKGALFLVDGAQAIGHKKINMIDMGIDLLASPAHKGLYGIQGCGFLAYSRQLILNPIKYGGTGTDSENLIQPKVAPEGYESGTLNTAGIASIKAGIEWVTTQEEEIEKKITYLSEIALNGIRDIANVVLYTHQPNGIISFEIIGKDSSIVCDILNDSWNIAVRGGLHCAPLAHKHLKTTHNGLVRASIGMGNTEKDIKRLIKAVKSIASS